MAVRRAIKGLLRRAGVDARRHDPWASLAARRAILLEDGGYGLVLDVGANSGQYGRELRAHGFRGEIVSFEPGRHAFQLLERTSSGDDSWSCRRLALGETSGRRSINIASNEGASSSFLTLTETHASSAPSVTFETREDVEVATLDEVASELLRDAAPVWLKLDVQGYELPVLTGAEATLPRIAALEVEVSLVELYQGQALFDELLRFIRDAGFRTADVSPEFVHPQTGRMLQANVIALRPAMP